MSPKKFDAQEWGGRLEAGQQDDPTLLLAAQLSKNRPDSRPLPPLFKEELRGRLLYRHARRPLGQWALSGVILLVLITAVTLFWSSLALPEQPFVAGSAGSDQQPAGNPPTLSPTLSALETTSTATAVATQPVAVEAQPEAGEESPRHQPNQALDNENAGFVPVDVWQSPAVEHSQVGGRFSLTLPEAQEQVAYPILAPTFLPDGFYFVGAGIAIIYPDLPLEPGAGMVFAKDVPEDRVSPLLTFDQHPVLDNLPNFDPHEYDDPFLSIQTVAIGAFNGDYRLDDRAGRVTLRWQAVGFRYTLTMNGELSPVEMLVDIANSLTERR